MHLTQSNIYASTRLGQLDTGSFPYLTERKAINLDARSWKNEHTYNMKDENSYFAKHNMQNVTTISSEDDSDSDIELA